LRTAGFVFAAGRGHAGTGGPGLSVARGGSRSRSQSPRPCSAASSSAFADKTPVACLVLDDGYRLLPVLVGVCAAFAVQVAVAPRRDLRSLLPSRQRMLDADILLLPEGRIGA
jgi:hypothetical protein